ncbi:MAG: hypothetical protein JSV04_06250 [Candidatus Heimdallarchaeota archaeon]|nr:MAG: hypothetical protein JSV04_06250 [Candidatus Heimdallarchaeota archaeon]
MKTSSFDKKNIIKQLVSQQFFIPPNLITDRTYSVRIEVTSSDRVFKQFSDFLYEISQNIEGIDPVPYNAVLAEAAEGLHLNLPFVQQRFHEKTHSFLKEGLATEDILFITCISSILEILDVRHFDNLVEGLRESYIHLCIQQHYQNTNDDLKTHFENGIKRLGEIADPHFSLLQNILKVEDLAHLLEIKINYDQDLVLEYNQRVVNKIISGGI